MISSGYSELVMEKRKDLSITVLAHDEIYGAVCPVAGRSEVS